MVEAEVEEAVVDVAFVGSEGVLSVGDSDDGYSDGIEERDDEDGEADGWGGIDVGGVEGVDVNLVEFDDEDGEEETYDEGAGVAHEYFIGLAPEVKDDEATEGAGECERDDGQFEFGGFHEPEAEGEGGNDTDGSSEAVDAIDHIKGVGDGDDDDGCYDKSGIGIDVIDTEEAVEVGEACFAEGDDEDGGDDLYT